MRTLLLIAAAILGVTVVAASTPAGGAATGVTTFATGLANPRGLAFGPDGQLYVAEGGDPHGNTMRTDNNTPDPGDDLCPQVGEVGPYTAGLTSRISRIDPNEAGHPLHTVVGDLPSSSTSPMSGQLTSGVADVTFLDGRLYGIEAGAGCSHGLADTHNSLFRVNGDGTTTEIANLSAFQTANPVANPDCCDFEPNGTWYSTVAAKGAIYAVEPEPRRGGQDHAERNDHLRRGRLGNPEARRAEVPEVEVTVVGDRGPGGSRR
jgi:hypothetical protein